MSLLELLLLCVGRVEVGVGDEKVQSGLVLFDHIALHCPQHRHLPMSTTCTGWCLGQGGSSFISDRQGTASSTVNVNTISDGHSGRSGPRRCTRVKLVSHGLRSISRSIFSVLPVDRRREPGSELQPHAVRHDPFQGSTTDPSLSMSRFNGLPFARAWIDDEP